MKYTYEEVKCHNTLNDCWIICNNNVYNITHFLNKHPGGNKIILDYGGLDITNNYILPEIYKKMGLENIIDINDTVIEYIISKINSRL